MNIQTVIAKKCSPCPSMRRTSCLSASVSASEERRGRLNSCSAMP
ncbi:hypothetical protein A2U01_0054753 [Trifolium medium]|uniref:Uncharacterized protein n=1 Tax=Trifolium medium TaxID=97028 RepID=A0A392RCI7_9FABA|nr:hypothetical protein [Trifolium medium]